VISDIFIFNQRSFHGNVELLKPLLHCVMPVDWETRKLVLASFHWFINKQMHAFGNKQHLLQPCTLSGTVLSMLQNSI